MFISFDNGGHWQSFNLQPAERADQRHQGAPEGPGDRDAGSRDVDHRQPVGAAPDHAADDEQRRCTLFTPRDGYRTATAPRTSVRRSSTTCRPCPRHGEHRDPRCGRRAGEQLQQRRGAPARSRRSRRTWRRRGATTIRMRDGRGRRTWPRGSAVGPSSRRTSASTASSGTCSTQRTLGAPPGQYSGAAHGWRHDADGAVQRADRSAPCRRGRDGGGPQGAVRSQHEDARAGRRRRARRVHASRATSAPAQRDRRGGRHAGQGRRPSRRS